MISSTRLKLLDDINQRFSSPFDEPLGYFFIYDAATSKPKVLKSPHGANPDTNSTQRCRESFSAVWGYAKHVDRRLGFFLHAGIDIEQVHAFFDEIHKALGIPNEITLHPTDTSTLRASGSTNRAVVIDLSEWWTANSLRREMMTLFIRCAVLHYKGDLAKAFGMYSLLASARRAVDLFLSGYTFTYCDWPGSMIAYLGGAKTDDQIKTFIFRTQEESDVAKAAADAKAAAAKKTHDEAMAAMASAQRAGANSIGIPMGSVPSPSVVRYGGFINVSIG